MSSNEWSYAQRGSSLRDVNAKTKVARAMIYRAPAGNGDIINPVITALPTPIHNCQQSGKNILQRI